MCHLLNLPSSEKQRAAGTGKEINLRLERGKGYEIYEETAKGKMREACFLKTYKFLEITQEKGGCGGGDTHESEWMKSGC